MIVKYKIPHTFLLLFIKERVFFASTNVGKNINANLKVSLNGNR